MNVGDRVMEVEVTTSPALSISEPQPVFSGQTTAIAIAGVGFHVSPDGSRFLVNRSASVASDTAVTIVQHWFAEFAGAKVRSPGR
jgi:hypothetical protein